MQDTAKIFGYTENNKTSYKLKFNQIENTTVSSVCGKSVFDFLWIGIKEFNAIFVSVAAAFAKGGVEQAVKAAAPFVDKNSYLTIYIAAFIDFLADENTADYFSHFLGSDFSLPQKGSSHYIMNVIDSMAASIEQKKAEFKFYFDKISKEKNGSLSQRFAIYADESKLFNFNFDVFYDADDETITYPLVTMDDVIRFDVMQMLVNKIKFKPCKCCGEYFIPAGRSNSEYCDRIMKNETRPCSEIGALKTFDIVHKNDDIHKAYITAYRRMDSRQRSKLITKDEFKEFGKLARAERKKCYNGEITLEQFQDWLDEHR